MSYFLSRFSNIAKLQVNIYACQKPVNEAEDIEREENSNYICNKHKFLFFFFHCKLNNKCKS